MMERMMAHFKISKTSMSVYILDCLKFMWKMSTKKEEKSVIDIELNEGMTPTLAVTIGVLA